MTRRMRMTLWAGAGVLVAGAGLARAGDWPGLAPPMFFPVGEQPFGLAEGDFNGDGVPDLVTADTQSDAITVLLGVGDGTFEPDDVYPTGAAPRDVATGDLDGDGDVDLAVAEAVPNTVRVFLGDGEGSFADNGAFAAGTNPVDILLADFNGDGDPDAATANQLGASASVLINQGDGTFGSPAILPAGSVPESVAAGDVDGDGDLDLAAANSFSNDVSVFLNDGQGGWEAAPTIEVPDGARAVAFAPLNEDESLDMVVTVGALVGACILSGNGDGTFRHITILEPGLPTPDGLSILDFDQDGFLDIAVMSNNPQNPPDDDKVAVYLGRGGWRFAPAQFFGVGDDPTALIGADLDGDGDPDLATANRFSDDVAVLLNERPGPPEDADFNGDGVVDGTDLGLLLGNWGQEIVADLNQDGEVDGADLGLLLGAWGPVDE